jgi:hypothetical protein
MTEDWKQVPLTHLLTDEQIKRLKTAKTIKEIKSITNSDTSKMAGLADPDYLAYAIANKLGIFS